MSTILRSAWRHLRNQPLWTCTALLCLALGTGANTAGLSVVNAFLLRPLPFPEPSQLVGVVLQEQNPVRNRIFSLNQFLSIASRTEFFTGLSARTFLPVSLRAEDGTRMVQAELVSANYFSILQVRPVIGRAFDQAESAGPVPAVLSDRLWRARFQADPSIVGKTAAVNGRPIVIIGVAPAGFVGVTQLIAADMWLPDATYPTLSGDPNGASIPMFGVVGRLRSEATRQQARDQLTATLSATDKNLAALVEPLSGLGFPGANVALLALPALLLGLVALVMAVAMANVAALMLAKVPARRAEIGVRLALGARSAHIAGQILIESLFLGLGGSALGAALAWCVTRFMPSLVRLPEHLMYTIDIRPDGGVMLYATIVAVLISVLFGLIPARQAARTDFLEALRAVGTARSNVTASRILSILVAGQMAAATALLAGCGVLARTYLDARGTDPGIDANNTLLISLDLTQGSLDAEAGQRFYDQLLDRVRSLPGVAQAHVMRDVPLFLPGGARQVSAHIGTTLATLETKVVSPGHFDTFRIPLIAGRDFSPDDRIGPAVAIVNETMARKFWPGQSPVGQRFEIENGTQPLEIIAVVSDIKYGSLNEDPQPVYYRPLAQSYSAQAHLTVRTSASEAVVTGVRDFIQTANPSLSIVDIRTMNSVIESHLQQRRDRAALLGVICGAGLLLSSIGLYGVIAFGVRERVREFGLRMALGAPRGVILRSVLYRGLRLAGVGFATGAVLSLGVTRVLASVFPGVDGQDAVVVVIVGAILSAVALVASLMPARWATKVDPAIALRND